MVETATPTFIPTLAVLLFGVTSRRRYLAAAFLRFSPAISSTATSRSDGSFLMNNVSWIPGFTIVLAISVFGCRGADVSRADVQPMVAPTAQVAPNILAESKLAKTPVLTSKARANSVFGAQPDRRRNTLATNRVKNMPKFFWQESANKGRLIKIPKNSLFRIKFPTDLRSEDLELGDTVILEVDAKKVRAGAPVVDGLGMLVARLREGAYFEAVVVDRRDPLAPNGKFLDVNRLVVPISEFEETAIPLWGTTVSYDEIKSISNEVRGHDESENSRFFASLGMFLGGVNCFFLGDAAGILFSRYSNNSAVAETSYVDGFIGDYECALRLTRDIYY